VSLNTTKVRGSRLERDFVIRWSALKRAPELDREVKVLGRDFRFDFAHRASRVLVEIDGGLWRGARGGHTSGAGAARDREKDFHVIMLGWVVVRLSPDMVKDWKTLEALAEFIRRKADGEEDP